MTDNQTIKLKKQELLYSTKQVESMGQINIQLERERDLALICSIIRDNEILHGTVLQTFDEAFKIAEVFIDKYGVGCSPFWEEHDFEETVYAFAIAAREGNKRSKDPDPIDLFEHYEMLPESIQAIIDQHCPDGDDMTYKECEAMLIDMDKSGYTFEYGLDASPFNLTKISNNA